MALHHHHQSPMPIIMMGKVGIHAFGPKWGRPTLHSKAGDSGSVGRFRTVPLGLGSSTMAHESRHRHHDEPSTCREASPCRDHIAGAGFSRLFLASCGILRLPPPWLPDSLRS
ncbi:hypothetical protein M758_4G094800 [Ceratodon purpureus]|nr:hypothetical protein M758_4G094800 [Ceratodon purpureus]